MSAEVVASKGMTASGKRTVGLESQVRHVWATPDCNTSTRSNGLMGPNIREQAANWPTPAAQDDNKSPEAYRRMREHKLGRTGAAAETISSLQVKVQTWPTPSASVANDGESPETWHARAAALKEKHGNGNGAGTPLTIASSAWPTPASRDQKGENSMAHMLRTDGRTDGRIHHIDQLPNFVMFHFSHQDQTMNDGQKSSAPDQTSRQRLNPQFVDWLMGWPPGWTSTDLTACDAEEMESYRSKLHSHLSLLLGEQELHREAA